MSDARRKTQRGYGKTGAKPKPVDCVSLDSDEPAASDPRVTGPKIHSAFQPLPVRAPYIVKTPRGGDPLPATASRTLGKDKE